MLEGRNWERVRGADRLLRLALVVLAIIGLRLGPGRAGWSAALALYFSLYAFGTVFARFLAPATPLLCLSAGVGIESWRRSRRLLG